MEKLFSCKECKELQPERAFSTFKMKNKEYRRGTCKYCTSKKDVLRVKEWRAEESIKNACRRLKLEYELVFAYYQSHNGQCEICGRKPNMNRLVLDHNHTTGAFRGLLCSPCNRGIGMLGDSESNLRNAITYIRANSI